jgi:hypothetical protein
MYQTQLISQFETLPAHLQRQVLDFVAFLVARYQVVGYDSQGQGITAEEFEESIHKARKEALERKVMSHEDLKKELQSIV